MIAAARQSRAAASLAAAHRRARWVSSVILPALPTSIDGHVLCAFGPAAYLQNQEGVVLALVDRDVGPGPLSIVVDGPPPGFDRLLHPGQAVSFEGMSIHVGELAVGWDAPCWPARPAWESLLTDGGRRLKTLRDSLIRHAPAGSLADLISPRRARATATLWLRPTAARTSELLSALPGDVRQPTDLNALARASAELAGLGGGFTPAGDDFLLGVMYAIRASIDDDRADVVCRAIAEAAVPRTTTVSGAYLRAGASGAAVAAWHALAGALIDDRPQAIDLAALRLTRLGHTSGADALAGFVLAGRRLAEAR